MKVADITQAPFGTIISLDEAVPDIQIIGAFLTIDETVFYKIKGIGLGMGNRPHTELLLDKTDNISKGQLVKFLQAI